MSNTGKSFDDWMIEESPFGGNENSEDCKWASKFMQQAYEAGQQSKQAEIDELQIRIDDALEKFYTGIRKQGGDYYLELIEGILKGDTK